MGNTVITITTDKTTAKRARRAPVAFGFVEDAAAELASVAGCAVSVNRHVGYPGCTVRVEGCKRRYHFSANAQALEFLQERTAEAAAELHAARGASVDTERAGLLAELAELRAELRVMRQLLDSAADRAERAERRAAALR